MYLEKNLEKKWIVKSENSILGPYNFDQIIDLIRKKQISLIDEIRDTETRWLYVRENSEFKSIVEEMRKEIDAKSESTKTYQGQTKAEEVFSKTTTTVEANHFTDINLETQDVAIVKETLSNSKEATPLVFANKTSSGKVYGIQGDTFVQKKMSTFSTRILMSFLVVAVLSVIAFFGYIYVQKRNAQKQEEELVIQIRRYKFLGLNEKAIEVYSKLTSTSQRKLIPDLLEIYPEMESAGLLSIDLLKSIKSDSNLTVEQKTNLELISFWQAMKQQNYGQAQDFLIKATTLQPASFLVKENEALLFLKKGEALSAFNQFKIIFNQQKNGRYLLGMVQAYYGLTLAEKSQNSRELLLNLERYTTVYYDYKKELLLAQISLAQELMNDILYKVSIKQFLNTPCRLSEQFVKPNLLAPNSYVWKDLNEVKIGVQKLLTGDDAILFQLHDLLEAEQLSAATDFLSVNLAKIVNLQHKEQMNLLLLDAQNRHQDVLALDKANKWDTNSELNHLLIAQNKLEVNPDGDISTHLNFLASRQQIFYNDWLELDKLIKRKQPVEIRNFIKDHFITTEDFLPVYEAKSMVNN